MGRCFIFGALDFSYMPYVPADGDCVIAADRGYDAAVAHGIEVDAVVGDFDSRGEAPDHPNVIGLNVRKDDTDVEHSMNVALGMGYRDFVVYGAVGGKLDHTVGNIAVAELAANSGGRAVFVGDDSSFTVIKDSSYSFDERESGRISVFSLSEVSRSVSVRGLSYGLDGAELKRAATLGVSNEFIGEPAEICVGDGTLLIIWDSEGE